MLKESDKKIKQIFKNKKVIKYIYEFFIFLFVFSIIKVNNNNLFLNTITANATNLSNKKICWGIKRASNHKQPDIGSNNKKILELYNGICMGKPESKKVYLTFDAGYEAGYTEKILSVLKENNVQACFFVTGHYVNSHPELVNQMIEEGHIIGNHTYNHKSMPDISNEEIKEDVMKLHTLVYDKFGYEMKYIRPPKGECSERTLAYTNSLGYKTVMWSMAYDDWEESKQGREEYGKKKILDNVHNGAVILLHSTSKDNSNILDDVIKEIRNMGYEFESLDNFIQ